MQQYFYDGETKQQGINRKDILPFALGINRFAIWSIWMQFSASNSQPSAIF